MLIHSINCLEYPMVMLGTAQVSLLRSCCMKRVLTTVYEHLGGCAALMSLGAICSPASPMFQASELALQATSAKVRMTLTQGVRLYHPD